MRGAGATMKQELGTLAAASLRPAPSFISRLGRTLLSAGAFLLGVGAVVAGINATVPFGYVFQVTPKLRYVEQHREQLDLLFCGSSRVFRHFMAPEFDRQMAVAGYSVRSFNLGIDAMPPPESFCVLRQALALHPKVRWVFIELWDIRTVGVAGSLEQKRFISWHDPRHTGIVLRRLFADSRVELGEKLARASIHLRAAFTRASRSGRGCEFLADAFYQDRKKAKFEEPILWLDRGGFAPGQSEPLSGAKRENYERAVVAMQDDFPFAPLPPNLRDEAAALAREVRAIGAEPVFVVMPTLRADENYTDLRGQGVDASFISLVSQARFPKLYDSQRHNDDWHLTETGARDFTRYLGAEFAALLQRQGVKPQKMTLPKDAHGH
jgi:hypothetical protein